MTVTTRPSIDIFMDCGILFNFPVNVRRAYTIHSDDDIILIFGESQHFLHHNNSRRFVLISFSVVSMDLEDVLKEDTHSVDMIHDETAPYLPVNLDLQVFGDIYIFVFLYLLVLSIVLC